MKFFMDIIDSCFEAALRNRLKTNAFFITVFSVVSLICFDVYRVYFNKIFPEASLTENLTLIAVVFIYSSLFIWQTFFRKNMKISSILTLGAVVLAFICYIAMQR